MTLPTTTLRDASTSSVHLLEQVSIATPGNDRLKMCIQCGTCGGSCPSAADMDHTPRALFALIRAGLRQEVLQSNTPWICVSCYNCVVRCPQEIHITDVMYTLKSLAIRAELYEDTRAPDFSETFVDMVERYGRSYELGLATRHYLRHSPLRLATMASLGLGMLSKKRMNMKPTKIVGMEQLSAILDRAKQLEAAS